MSDSYYFEKCDCTNVITYSFFTNKLDQVQKFCNTIDINNVSKYGIDLENYPIKSNKFYVLGNIIWADNINQIIKLNQHIHQNILQMLSYIHVVQIKKLLIHQLLFKKNYFHNSHTLCLITICY